jgi:GxxExxY protein
MHDNLTYQINGCLFKVYNQLQNIWQEEVYEEALHLELQNQKLQAETQKNFEVFYFDKRVGVYWVDVLVENTVIIELKAVPEMLPVHKAQLISYLKGYNKPIGILANFGGKSFQKQTFPNNLAQKTPLIDTFDFDKVQLKGKEDIKELLLIANRILITLGAGYLPQIYRRAFYYELEMAGMDFDAIKEVKAIYNDRPLSCKEVHKEVYFFRIGTLLLSVETVNELNPLTLSKFSHYIKYLNCKKGLIFNFNAVCLDYRYFC